MAGFRLWTILLGSLTLREKGAETFPVKNFICLEVGEGIEKVVVDFAAEVAAQVAATKA